MRIRGLGGELVWTPSPQKHVPSLGLPVGPAQQLFLLTSHHMQPGTQHAYVEELFVCSTGATHLGGLWLALLARWKCVTNKVLLYRSYSHVC